MSMLRWFLPVTLLAATTTIAEAAPGAWSSTVDGLRARLVTTPTTDASKRAQLEIWLEIENVSDTDGGIPLPWGYVGDMLQFVVEDGAGKAVAGAGVGGSHASGPPYVVALPVGATLRVPISKGAYEYPQGSKIYFRPLTFQAWDLPAKRGKWTLRATLSPHVLGKGTKAGSRAWSTPIDLPKVELP
jgi:hypothetical protein